MGESRLSWRSEDSFLSICSKGSMLSIGSIGSFGSMGSIGSALSVLSVGSVCSVGSVLSAFSAWSLMSSRSSRGVLAGTPVEDSPQPGRCHGRRLATWSTSRRRRETSSPRVRWTTRSS